MMENNEDIKINLSLGDKFSPFTTKCNDNKTKWENSKFQEDYDHPLILFSSLMLHAISKVICCMDYSLIKIIEHKISQQKD